MVAYGGCFTGCNDGRKRERYGKDIRKRERHGKEIKTKYEDEDLPI